MAPLELDAVVVEGDRFTAHGDVWQFVDGRVTKVGG